MFVLGVTFTLISSLLYSFRSSFLRDLGLMNINKPSVTLFFRLFSLPIILIIFYYSGENLIVNTPIFYAWLFMAILLNLFVSMFQLKLYQRHLLSTIESQKFLGVLFASIGGYYLFYEILGTREIVGIIVLVIAFVIMFLLDSNRRIHFDVVFYYFLLTCVDIINRQTIHTSSPLIFSVYITVAMIISNYLFALFRGQRIYMFHDGKINSRLIITGLISAFAIIGTSYGYQYLPVGLVVTLLSTQTFFSLGLSHFKHKESNLFPKVVTASIAFLGIISIFL